MMTDLTEIRLNLLSESLDICTNYHIQEVSGIARYAETAGIIEPFVAIITLAILAITAGIAVYVPTKIAKQQIQVMRTQNAIANKKS